LSILLLDLPVLVNASGGDCQREPWNKQFLLLYTHCHGTSPLKCCYK